MRFCFTEVSAVKKRHDQGPAKGMGPWELTLIDGTAGPMGVQQEGAHAGKPRSPLQSWGAGLRREFPS